MEAQREYRAAPVALKMIVTSLKMAFVVYLTYLPVCCMHTMSKSSSKSILHLGSAHDSDGTGKLVKIAS